MVCIFNFRLERIDFIPIHFSLRRPLAGKTENINDDLIRATAITYQTAENNLKEMLILAREIKVLLKAII